MYQMISWCQFDFDIDNVLKDNLWEGNMEVEVKIVEQRHWWSIWDFLPKYEDRGLWDDQTQHNDKGLCDKEWKSKDSNNSEESETMNNAKNNYKIFETLLMSKSITRYK